MYIIIGVLVVFSLFFTFRKKMSPPEQPRKDGEIRKGDWVYLLKNGQRYYVSLVDGETAYISIYKTYGDISDIMRNCDPIDTKLITRVNIN